MSGNDSVSVGWAIGLALGFPLCLLLLNEFASRTARDGNAVAPAVRSIRNLLAPAAGIAVFALYVVGLPAANGWNRAALTLFWIAALFVGLEFLSSFVFGAADAASWRANVPKLARDIIRTLLVCVGAAFIYSEVWGKDLAGAVTALGVGSLVLGLALQEPLGNVFSGLMLLFERPVSLGDWIEVEGKPGVVTDMNWRAVNMETVTRETIIVPNSVLYKTSFVNLSRPTAVRTCVAEVSLSFNDAPNHVKETLVRSMVDTPGVLADPAPMVHVGEYEEFAIRYRLHFSVASQHDVLEVRDEVLTRAWYAIRRGRLTIPYPVEVDPESVGMVPPNAESSALRALHSRFEAPSEPALPLLDFARGEWMLKHGDEQDGLCLILSGHAVLQASDGQGGWVEIGHLGPGDFYGEHSILAGGASQVALRAATDAQVALLDLESSRTLVEQSPKLAREVGEVIEQRRRAAQMARRRNTNGMPTKGPATNGVS